MTTRLLNIDCMEFMAGVSDNHFDLAIVDPPYGINASNMTMGSAPNRTVGGYPGVSVAEKLKKGRLNSGAGKLKNRALNQMPCDWDFFPPGKEYFTELMRVSKNQIIWGGNYFDLPPTRGVACWNKLQPWGNFSQFELAWTSFNKPAKLLSLSGRGGANRVEKIHPTQKPVKLYQWLLDNYAKPGQRILDTHLGSGSSAIAAHYFGCDFIGCEIDKEYFKAAQQRFNDETRQQVLI